jgi:DNA-binding MarR family transcriptional regulator
MSAHSPSRKAEHLLQLSSEVSRIAGTLARLSGEPDAVERGNSGKPEAVEISPKLVNAIIRARRLRSQFFADGLFADPAWDILLDLFQAELLIQRVAVSTLGLAAGVPATTALRWITTLVDRGLIVRRPDPLDGRRVFIELAPETSSALRRYFAEILDVPTI